jgi:hypothetical protein
MMTWDDKPNDYEHALKLIERLQAALQWLRDYGDPNLVDEAKDKFNLPEA